MDHVNFLISINFSTLQFALSHIFCSICSQDSSGLDTIDIDEADDAVLVPPPRNPSNGVIRHSSQASSATTTSVKQNSSSSTSSKTAETPFFVKEEKPRSSSSSNSRAKVTLSSDFMKSGPSGSKKGAGSREITFNVRLDTTGAALTAKLAECETVDTLKTLIHAQ